MAMGGGQCVSVGKSKVGFFMKGSPTLPTLLKDYTPSTPIQSSPPAAFCFDAAGRACGEGSLEKQNGTDILHCPPPPLTSAPNQAWAFDFGGGITLPLFAETGFVQ